MASRPPSSAPPATPARRRSTACSRTRELELVALGSDSLAGQPASALDPRLNGDAAARSSRTTTRSRAGADARLPLPRPRASGRARAASRRRRRRPLRRPPAARRRALRSAGTASSIRAPRRSASGATPCPSSSRRGAADREPRLLRDRGAARARAARATRSTGRRRRRREVGRLRRRPGAEGRARTRASVLENVSPYKVGAHQHAPEIEQALGFPVCFVPHLLPVRRGLIATCYVQTDADAARGCSRRPTRQRRSSRVLPEGVAPELSRVQGTDAAEIGVFTDRATGTGDRRLRARQPRQGRRRARRCRTRTSRSGCAETAGLRLQGVLV